MTAETLSSHHLNYLIWRYLQEAGHGEAAVKLQRDWNLDPQGLPFAEYVKTHALVTIVQKGLQYDALERSLSQAGNLDESLGFFGPVTPLAPTFPPQDAIGRGQSPSKSSTFARRYPRENGTNGLLSETSSLGGTKRNRRSTETANGIDRAADADLAERNLSGLAINGNGYVPMLLTDPSSTTLGSTSHFTGPKSPTNDDAPEEEIDADVDMGMSASETTTPILPPTEGPSVETQTLQTWNEGREMTRPPSRPQTDPPCETLPVADGMHVMSTKFNPQNPNVLVATGKQMCRLWDRRGDPFGRSSSHQYEDILHPGSAIEVTAAAWDSRGYRLAVATFKQSEWGQINIYDEAGFLTDTLPGAQNLITALRWQPNESQLLGISSDGLVNEVIVWDLSTGEELAPMKVRLPVTDAIWTGLNQFHACGGDSVYACRADRDIQITKTQSSNQSDEDDWSYIRFTPAESYSVTVVASVNKCTIWIPEHDVIYRQAHQTGMTGIEFGPRSATDPTLKDPIKLATSSMDGTVKIWLVRVPEKHIFQICSLELGMDIPAISLSWSPDAAHMAAVSASSMFVWKLPRGSDPQLRSISHFDDTKESGLGFAVDSDPSISWAADSSCIAFGKGSKLSILGMHNMLSIEDPPPMPLPQ